MKKKKTQILNLELGRLTAKTLADNLYIGIAGDAYGRKEHVLMTRAETRKLYSFLTKHLKKRS